MKKNKTLKVACGLLVMVLLTTCVISTTLARYTTSDTASDTARVAKWGLEVSTSGTLFGPDYIDKIVASNDENMTVSASQSARGDVVAPGTKNDIGFQIRLNGQPEVDFTVKAEYTAADVEDIFIKAGTYATVVVAYGVNEATDFANDTLYTENAGTYTKVDSYTAGTTYYRLVSVTVNETATTATHTADGKYYPIAWTGSLFQKTSESDTGTSYPTSYCTLAKAVESLTGYINGHETKDGASTYQTNDYLNDTYTLTWAWEYQNGNDVADTLLGNLMANANSVVKTTNGGATFVALESGDYNLEVNCDITVTATQVD